MAEARATALALVLALSACENPVDTTPNVIPGGEAPEPGPEAPALDAAGDAPGDAPATEACGCLAAGQWFRFDMLAVTSLDKGEHPVTETLSVIWAKDIEKLELNFLLEITEVTPDEVKLRVVNGARVDGTSTEVCALADTAIELRHPRDGCLLLDSDAAGMNVYAGSTAFPKNCVVSLEPPHAIHVRNVVVRSRVTETCDGIVDGEVLEGSIGKDELEGTCTCLIYNDDLADQCGPLDPAFARKDGSCQGCNDTFQKLSDLVTAFGELDYLCQTPDARPAVCLTAVYTARAIAPVADCP